MENYYEVTGISTASEIEKAYLTAVAENKQFYRAISRKGTIYGWVNGHHKEAPIGQEWFENDQYVAPIEEPIEEINEPLEDEPTETAENIDETAVEVDTADKERVEAPMVDETITENEVADKTAQESEMVQETENTTVVENPTEISYQALYEDAMKQVGAFGEVIAEKDLLIQKLQADNEQLATELAEYKTTIAKFVALFRG